MFNAEKLNAYSFVKMIDMPDISSKGYLLTHNKSGARILLVSNEDDNKVFSIGFRTPPTDSTGVPHIMEHSVLCGSKKFPVKDPFVELIKGSLNTFLNAMTFPDKTLYPVASCNDKDFSNLVDVYMDAVFYPNIYTRHQIFKQEGWHYEMLNPADNITINGVVYNEMKGAFSSPDDVLEREVFNSLFPDTSYAKESGGDPDVIPELTYEQFIEFHKTLYHPSNSYIYLYGNMDFEQKLEWMDKEYLSKFDKINIDTSIAKQGSFGEVKRVEKKYGITEDESEESKTYLAKSYVIDNVLNKELYVALSILDYALVSAPGARLKQRLLDEKIGNDVYSSYENGILQPYFSIIAKDANASDEEKFLQIIDEELRNIVKEGIDKKALLAAINMFEFRYREADFGSYPKGLMYGLMCYESWIYDENEPVMHVLQNDVYKMLREALKGRYFEELIEKYLINSEHSSVVVIKPEKGLTTKKEQLLAKKLEEYKASLSDEEINKIIEDTKALKEYQEEPSTQEELKSIPLLEISDIKKEAEPLTNEEIDIDGIPVLFHEVETNGIGYMTLMFSANHMDTEDLSALGILSLLMGFVSTKNYHYSELFNEINIKSGGINTAIGSYQNLKDLNKFRYSFDFVAKFLYDQADFVFDMLSEIVHTSDFDDRKRIRELLLMTKSRMQASLMQSGHTASVKRALSYISKSGYLGEKINGISAYRYIDTVEADFDNLVNKFTDDLKRICADLFLEKGLMVDFTGTKEGLSKIKAGLIKFRDSLTKDDKITKEFAFIKDKNKEAFKTSGQVQYVASCGNYRDKGLDYDGALKVLRSILSSDYLWTNVRVMGGAYGCMCAFPRSGDSYMVSYRDPHLKNTLSIYKDCVEYIKNVEIEDRDMTKYIIGTISDMDVPLTPRARGARSLSAYMAGCTFEDIQTERDAVLSCNQDKIRSLSKYIEAVISQEQICVIGAEDKINENSELFDEVENLF